MIANNGFVIIKEWLQLNFIRIGNGIDLLLMVIIIKEWLPVNVFFL